MNVTRSYLDISQDIRRLADMVADRLPTSIEETLGREPLGMAGLRIDIEHLRTLIDELEGKLPR